MPASVSPLVPLTRKTLERAGILLPRSDFPLGQAYRLAVVLWASLSITGRCQRAAERGFEARLVPSSPSGSATVEITFASSPLLRLSARPGGESLRQGKALVEALVHLFGSGRTAGDIAWKDQGKTAWIAVAGTRTIEVTEADAKRCHSSVATLAQAWVRSLRAAYSDCGLVVSPRSVTLAVGETTEVACYGQFADRVSLTGAGSEIVEATVDAKRAILKLFGRAVGKTQAMVQAGACALPLDLDVRLRAGRLTDDNPGMLLHGSGLPSYLSALAAENALWKALALQPSAECRVVSQPIEGAPEAAFVRVQAAAPSCLPMERTVRLQVSRQAPRQTEPKGLLVSNQPETVDKICMLLESPVPAGGATRLLLHHKSNLLVSAQLCVELLNPSSVPSRVFFRTGQGGPSESEMHSGFVAARDWFAQSRSGSGCELWIPANKGFRILTLPFLKGRVVSALMEVEPLEGIDLTVQVKTIPEGFGSSLFDLGQYRSPSSLSAFYYPHPLKTVQLTYEIGKAWAFLSMGRRGITNWEGKVPLHGDYGVTYRGRVTIVNPLNERKEVEMVFAPTGGAAHCVANVDGRQYATGAVAPPSERALTTVIIEPVSQRELSFESVPVAGSNYPASFIVRERV